MDTFEVEKVLDKRCRGNKVSRLNYAIAIPIKRSHKNDFLDALFAGAVPIEMGWLPE